MAEKRKDSKGRVLKNGESQRKNGQYVYQYFDANGKRCSVYSWRLVSTDRFVEGKKKEPSLREKEKQIQKDLIDGIVSDKTTVKELLIRNQELKIGVKQSTRRAYKSLTSSILNAVDIGDRLVSTFKQSDAKEVIASMSVTNGYHTTRQAHVFLKQAFDIAVNDDMIRKNPFDFRSRLQNNAEGRVPITDDEERRLLDFLIHSYRYRKYYDITILLLRTGMRVGELCGLTVSDLDFESRCIHITKQMQFEEGYMPTITTPKSKSGYRDIPMSDETETILRNMIMNRHPESDAVEVDGHSGFLLTTRNGGAKSKILLDRQYRAIVEEYNRTHEDQLPNITPHVLRHTFCTRLANAGMNPKKLQYVMGHSNINMTLDVYAHTNFEEVKDEMLNLIG